MATEIRTTIFSNAEEWLKAELPEYINTDGVAAVYPISDFDADFGRTYRDDEIGEEKYCDFKRHVEALKLLVQLIAAKQLFVGGIKNPADLTDTGNWDVEVSDAYFQLVYHGVVQYG